MMRDQDIFIMGGGKQYKIRWMWIFIVQMLVIGLSFSIFLNPHYSIDSYGAYSDASHYLSDGRVVAYLISNLLKIASINPVKHQEVFIFLEILFMASSASLLIRRYCLYCNDISLTKFVLINLCFLISFVNIYILEWYLFPELSYIFGLGFLLTTLAILKMTEENSIRNLLSCFIFLSLSVNIYQINITIFIIFSLTFLLVKDMYSITIKSIFNKIFTVIFICGITMLTNIVIMKLMPLIGLAQPNTRVMSISFSNLWNRFISLISNEQYSIWFDGSGFLGNGVMGAFLLISINSFVVYD
jgi:hypothetical protein